MLHALPNFNQSDITLEGDEIKCVLNEIKVIFKKRSEDGVQLYSFCCSKTGQVKVCLAKSTLQLNIKMFASKQEIAGNVEDTII